MKIAVIGAGGVGGYFGARLAAAGEEVTFIARGAHLAAMQGSGLKVLSANGDLHLQPVRATDDATAVGPVDLVMIAVKLWSTDEAIGTARTLAGPGTAVVSFQNGVEAVDKLVAAFGRERVLGGVANIAALIEAPGVVRHNGTMALLQFGELDGSRTARVAALLAACNRAGIDAKVPDDIRKAIWEKYVFLASLSGMTALTRLPLGPLRADPDTRALFRQLAAEVVAVGRGKGVSLDDRTVEAMMQRLDALPPGMVASMLGDLQRGNRLELPWLSGGVDAMGRELGVPTPGHHFVYVALKLYAEGQPAHAG
jgi:2-dehydropantoate 2-reductase